MEKPNDDETSRKLWTGIRVYCNGAYHKTKYVEKTEKDGIVTVSMELIKEEPQEGGFKERIAKILEIPADKMGKVYRLQDIFDVINEASKEFPTYELARLEYLKRTGQTQLETAIDAAGVQLVLNELRDTWFLKWLEKEGGLGKGI